MVLQGFHKDPLLEMNLLDMNPGQNHKAGGERACGAQGSGTGVKTLGIPGKIRKLSVQAGHCREIHPRDPQTLNSSTRHTEA